MSSLEENQKTDEENLSTLISKEILKVVTDINDVLSTKTASDDYFPQKTTLVKPNFSPEDVAFAQKIASEMKIESSEEVNVTGESPPQ